MNRQPGLRVQVGLLAVAVVLAFAGGWFVVGRLRASPTVATSVPHAPPGLGDGGVPATGPLTEPEHSAVAEAQAPARVPSARVPKAPIKAFACPRPTVTVHTEDELDKALRGPRPGASIRLADGVYTGTFTATGSGSATKPVYLCGGRGAILDGGSITGGYVLHLDHASQWRLSGFTVRNGQKGVMVDAGHAVALQGLLVQHLGDEAVHLRAGTTGSVVRDLTIRDTGNRRDKFGEGVYVGSAQSNWGEVTGGRPDASNGNFVLGNTISATTAEAVDIKEGTSGGVVAGNTFDGARLSGADSWVDVKGNGWLIAGNRGRNSPEDGFQTHVIVDGWGTANRFMGNVAALGHGTGVGYYVHHALLNVVACDNRASGAADGLTNVKCH